MLSFTWCAYLFLQVATHRNAKRTKWIWNSGISICVHKTEWCTTVEWALLRVKQRKRNTWYRDVKYILHGNPSFPFGFWMLCMLFAATAYPLASFNASRVIFSRCFSYFYCIFRSLRTPQMPVQLGKSW